MNNENNVLAETELIDIGRQLMEARESKGLSIEEVEKETSIRKIYLRAVEANDFASVPGEVFVKGILRTYGNYLGLDGVKMVEDYKVSTRGLQPDKATSSTIREAKGVKVVPSFKPNNEYETSNKNMMVYVLVGVLAALLIACGLYYLWFNKGTNPAVNEPLKPPATAQSGATAAPQPAKPADSNKGNEQQAVNAAETAKEKANTDLAAKPVEGQLVVEVTVDDDCWLEVKEGQKTIFEDMLGAKESKSFTSKTGLTIVYGNINVAHVKVNGQTIPSIKSKNSVVVKEYKVAK